MLTLCKHLFGSAFIGWWTTDRALVAYSAWTEPLIKAQRIRFSISPGCFTLLLWFEPKFIRVVKKKEMIKSLVFVTRHRRWCSSVQVPAEWQWTPAVSYLCTREGFQSFNVTLHEDLQTARQPRIHTYSHSSFLRQCLYLQLCTLKKDFFTAKQRKKKKWTWEKFSLQKVENSCVSANVSRWRRAVPDKNQPGWFDATWLQKVFPRKKEIIRIDSITQYT